MLPIRTDDDTTMTSQTPQPPAAEDTDVSKIDALVEASARAHRTWSAQPRADRAAVLTRIAGALDEAADTLVPLAQSETNLPEPRLRGELTRTTFQLRLLAEAVAEGGYLDVRVDHADADWPMGPRPDVRRTQIPLGPVLVFAASNFPFAFSVMGGDSAAALAAGCSVVLKAHPGHQRLSAATTEVVTEALRAAGAVDGLFQTVYGVDAGVAALQHPLVKAAAFTGSIPGGRALFDIATSRPEPIPFYGELGSVNPVFVTSAADTARGADVAEGLMGSFTLGAGQFCTKPGVVLAPAGGALVSTLRSAELPDPTALLNPRITEGYLESSRALREHQDVDVLAEGSDPLSDPPGPSVLTLTAAALLADFDTVFTECFGPTVVVATYDDEAQMLEVAERLDGQLTATVVGEAEEEILHELVPVLATKAGRVLWNQWPTGVTVSYAQHHGGPYPATTAPGTTSVGTAALSRFIRPVAFQGFPDELLPAELREEAPGPRRVDGVVGADATQGCR